MNKEEYQKIIKEEGDYMEFESYGLPCVIRRAKEMGHWCGYVGVSQDSRLNGKKYYYYSENESSISKLEQEINNIAVHGGLTFAGKLKEDDLIHYFGFDCGHLEESIIPHFLNRLCFDYPGIKPGAIYRDKNYVIKQCERLAEQLSKIIADDTLLDFKDDISYQQGFKDGMNKAIKIRQQVDEQIHKEIMTELKKSEE